MRDTAVRTRPRPRRLRLMGALAGMILATLITAGPALAAPPAPVKEAPATAQPAVQQPGVFADFDGDTIKAQKPYIATELVVSVVILGGAALVVFVARRIFVPFVGIRPFGKYGPEL